MFLSLPWVFVLFIFVTQFQYICYSLLIYISFSTNFRDVIWTFSKKWHHSQQKKQCRQWWTSSIAQFTRLMYCLCEHVRPTCGAALVDDGAQSLAHCEPQVWLFIDGYTNGAGEAFERHQQVHGTRAEAREHGPNLKIRRAQTRTS